MLVFFCLFVNLFGKAYILYKVHHKIRNMLSYVAHIFFKLKGSKKENYFWGAFYDVSKQKLETEWQICGRHAVFDGGINVLHLLWPWMLAALD